jgi:hypothetical protein
MKKKKQEPEILTFDKESLEVMKKAVENVSRRTFISNNSITFNDEGNMIIEDTRSSFLLNIGMEYQKLLKPFCPVCHSLIEEK